MQCLLMIFRKGLLNKATNAVFAGIQESKPGWAETEKAEDIQMRKMLMNRISTIPDCLHDWLTCMASITID